MNNRYQRNPRARAARLRLISELRDRRERVVAPLRRGIFLVPVTITSLGLLAGFYSLISAINGHFVRSAVLIAFAFVCDGLDGRVARLSRTSSPFGVEYDSLSDVVAFGVAPAVLAYTWALRPLRLGGVIIAGLYVVFAAFRLARFNIQTGSVDKRRFIGLPVPGAAAMIAGLVFAYHYFYIDAPQMLVAVIAPVTAALGILMISRVPYPSFKSIDFYHRAPLAVTAGVMVVLTCLVAVPQVTACVLATAYVLSGPFLMLAGEQMTARMPVLRPSEDPNPKVRETSPLGSQQG
jgi:CDP-diacylglycerol---serine O-phosphatidyltransferase